MAKTGVDFLWRDVVIGNEINAIRYSFEREAYLLRNCSPGIHSYELFANSDVSIEEAWAEKSYELFQLGRDPFTNNVITIRVEADKSMLKVTTRDHQAYRISYKNLYLFNLENVLFEK